MHRRWCSPRVAAIRGSEIDVRFPHRLPDINHLIEIGEKK